ncbi:Tn3 family transposase [Streptomyces sp. NPDC058301]|uniref:Tn3 family transposase n=1 Tax=Streptomyces sp. NPDC058301 TaxID=3346436 RepID=UPI0036EBE9F1
MRPVHVAEAAEVGFAQELHLHRVPRGRPCDPHGATAGYLSDAPLRRRAAAATNKVERFNRFSQWVGFGNQGVLADSTHERANEPAAYDPPLDVGFSPLRSDGPPADGFGQAA